MAIIEDFQSVIDIFVEDADGKPLTKAYVDDFLLQRVFLEYRGIDAYSELMLRLNKHNKRLVIARILFHQQRNGYGTKLLTELEKYGRANGYTEVYVESVLSESMEQFLNKHGFRKDEPLNPLCFDWVREIGGMDDGM